MYREFEQCYRALQSRDERFDGWFVAAVATTGIYCRPSCPASTPKPQNVSFWPTAAVAQQLGYRACKRCRPDASPGSPQWRTRQDVVAQAMQLIADGVVDREGVPGLARRLGYSERQLNRRLVDEVGTGPLAIARAQRAQTARVLVETSDLAMTEIAFAAGFASVRQFNDVVREVFASTPTELRAAARRRSTRDTPVGAQELVLRLAHRGPFAVGDVFGFLGLRAVPGVESWDGETYGRTLRLPLGTGTVRLAAGDGYVSCRLSLEHGGDLTAAVDRCRRLLDLDADPRAVDDSLSGDPDLARLVARRPGLRSPGHVDGAELAARAILGQQVSVVGARTLAARAVASLGEPLGSPDGELTHLFPSAASLAASARDHFAMPASRHRALVAVSDALDSGRSVSVRAPTTRRRTGDCSPSRASVRGRRPTSSCARSARRTDSSPTTSGSATPRPRSDGPRTWPRCGSGPNECVRGGAT
ncbi:MAG: AlkA N-terminal domain-containing protein [Ilumatobacteraceae bacterium]